MSNGDRDTLMTPLSPVTSVSPARTSESRAEAEAVTVAASKPSKDANAPKAETSAASRADDGESSIPPVVDLDEQFFSERLPKVAHADFHGDDLALDAAHDPKLAHKMSPAVRARRERFAGYVKIAVGVCGAVVLAAAFRVAGGNSRDVEPVNVASAMTQTEADATEARRATAPVTAEPAAPRAVVVVPTRVEASQPVPESVAAAAPLAPSAVAAASVADPVGDAPAKRAADEKKNARTALERGQSKKAVEAGERAVALDPTDGESWLLLGAAYQEIGKPGDARRCFTSCVKEGKKGPIGECRAMLR